MKVFTEHPAAQGFTFVSHLVFAGGIALRLLQSAIAFALHALFPFIPIEPRLDLEATSAYLLERNRFVERQARDFGKQQSGGLPQLPLALSSSHQYIHDQSFINRSGYGSKIDIAVRGTSARI